MSDMKTDDVYACTKCGFELKVVVPCECKPGCAQLKCCGQDLEKK